MKKVLGWAILALIAFWVINNPQNAADLVDKTGHAVNTLTNQNDNGQGSNDNNQGSSDNNQGSNDNDQGSNDNDQGSNDNDQGSNDNDQGP